MATIDLIVLGMLKKQPLSAYDIQKLVEYRNISKWVRISTPSIYKKVIQLEEKGSAPSVAVRENNMPEKAVYSLTASGERAFERLMEELSLQPVRMFLDFNAVIVNLGTNDCGALSSPAWADPVTGESFQQHRDEKGGFVPEDRERFQTAVKSFLSLCGRKTPTHSLCGYMVCWAGSFPPMIAEAVREYIQETGDPKAAYWELTDAVEHRGARSHPGKAAHELAAREIAEKLRGLI